MNCCIVKKKKKIEILVRFSWVLDIFKKISLYVELQIKMLNFNLWKKVQDFKLYGVLWFFANLFKDVVYKI